MHRTSKPKKEKIFALHRWFFPLAMLGGVLLVLLPMLLTAPKTVTLIGITVSGSEAAVPELPPLTLSGLAARAVACADRLLAALGLLLVYAAAGTLAVRTVPVGKKLLFIGGLLPFMLQSACGPALTDLLFLGEPLSFVPQSACGPALTCLLPALFLLYFAQVLALAFASVRAGGGRWVCFLLTGGALLALCLLYRPMLLPVLLCVGCIPLRRFLPLRLLAPSEVPDAAGLRRARIRRFWLGLLRRTLGIGFAIGAVVVCAAVLPAPRVMHNLLQHRTEFLLGSAADKGLKLLRLLLGGSFAAADGSLLLHAGAIPLLWALLLASAAFGTARIFRPNRRQRALVLAVCAAAVLGNFLAFLSWAELFSTAAALFWVLPVLAWALTPHALVLRRERPARLVPAAALALVLTAVPVLGACL